MKEVSRQVALLIMDTQGAFNCNSTTMDCTSMFVLSFLLSSIQIYNLSSDITERDLEHLQVIFITTFSCGQGQSTVDCHNSLLVYFEAILKLMYLN